MNGKISTAAILIISTAVFASAAPEEIFNAIGHGNLDWVIEMLETNKTEVLQARTDTGISSLHYAASLDAAEAVYRLLAAGMNPNIAVEGSKTTPLMFAVTKNASDSARILLQLGADPNLKAKNDFTALHFLARVPGADPRLVTILKNNRAKNADLNASNHTGETPLHIATEKQNPAVVKALLENGADFNRKNNNGKTPPQLAYDNETRAVYEAAGVKLQPVVLDEVKPPAEPQIKKFDDEPPPPTDPIHEENAPAPVAPDSNEKRPKSKPITEVYEELLKDPTATKYPNGSVYKGVLRNGKREGFGLMIYATLESYSGEWKNDLRNGQGSYFYANQNSYSGRWSKNVPDGDGVFSYANGGAIKGVWKNGIVAEGTGFYINSDGRKHAGVWKDGVIVSSQEVGE